MTKKQSRLLCYALVLSIFLMIAGFLGVGVRAFASAGISSTIFLAILGIVITIAPTYFILRRPVPRHKKQVAPTIARHEPQPAELLHPVGNRPTQEIVR
jgi:uncharacterized membrane protein YfcA